MTTTIRVKGSVAPADSFTPIVMDGYQAQRPTGNTTHEVPGRVNPVIFFHPTKGRRGTFKLVLGDETAAVTFNALITRKVVFTLADSDRGIVGMDFAVADEGHTIELEEQTRDVFIATVPFVEQ